VSDSSLNDRVRAIYDHMAPKYDRNVRFCEWVLGLDRGRRWIASRAEGGVLEIGIGTGRNLAYYPAKHTKLTGIDLAPAMLQIARKRAADLGCEVDLRTGNAERLDFRDEQFDTIVCTLALCSIPRDRRAITEAKRVLRPGGRLLLLEHVRSPMRIVRAVQYLLEPLFLKFQEDHLLREPLEHVQAEGFELVELHRSSCGIIERLVARKPQSS
jgi:ubiquinone/menaquinone biosynthesis C-methylase UbiE